ncbi:MAG: hypothetical protein PHX83_04105 [Acidobacteriia bacterium]|nr:hypothetical protein [Terriglobia bacterium]
MGSSPLTTETILAQIDAVLADPKVFENVRAFLLLRICQITQVFRPDVYEKYFPKLQQMSGRLNIEQRQAFDALAGLKKSSAKQQGGKFAQSVAASVETASQKASSNPEEARTLLRHCCQRIVQRKWPWGKKASWAALLPSWAEVDRAEALKYIGKVPVNSQNNLLQRLNDRSPLNPEEWDFVQRHAGSWAGIKPLLCEILDREKPVLNLGKALTEDLSRMIRAQVHATSTVADAERKMETEREKALQRYLRLVQVTQQRSPDEAEALMEALLVDSFTTKRFNEKWAERFTYLRELINVWANLPSHQEKAKTFLREKTPAHLRDFCLAQWYGVSCSKAADAFEAWKELEPLCKDKVTTEAWFLITLLRRGLGEAALELTRNSPRSAELFPRVRRAWIFLNPETAASVVRAEDLAGDVVGQFMLLGASDKRMEFLRERSVKGSDSLPSAFWARNDLMDVVNLLDSKKRTAATAYERVRLSLYSKSEKADNQFTDYIRMHGYGEYSCDQVDPFLLAALAVWDDAHPEEVKSLIKAMWKVIKPFPSELRFDLLRNSIFERCYTVFAARPEAMTSAFVQWVKSEAVDKSVQEQVGTTIYTFRLNDVAPFLYCLLGAQKVGRFSAKRCDELLTSALRLYTANEDLIGSAAQLYAVDKGLNAIQPPTSLKNSTHLQPWQMGVAEVSLKSIITTLISESPVLKKVEEMATVSA